MSLLGPELGGDLPSQDFVLGQDSMSDFPRFVPILLQTCTLRDHQKAFVMSKPELGTTQNPTSMKSEIHAKLPP